jgi:hypothetical protein
LVVPAISAVIDRRLPNEESLFSHWDLYIVRYRIGSGTNAQYYTVGDFIRDGEYRTVGYLLQPVDSFLRSKMR